jgi:xanthine dehydrogenase accessory factor
VKEIREIIRFWEAHRDEPLALATLVRAHGSSYRRPGARMLIGGYGASAGSLSAGCIEEEVIAFARDVICSGKPQLLSFDTRRRFGCSGCIEIFVEPVRNDLLRELRAKLAGRQSVQIATVFEDSDLLGSRIASGNEEEDAFVQTILPALRLILIGAGPDAVALRAHATLLGWEVVAIEAITELRDPPDERTAAVIATHNFGRDCAALRYLLPLGLRYIALVGPRRRRDEILIDVIDSGAEIKSQLFAPAGLDLAADSPEEIALSIVAEIQGVFAHGTTEHLRDRKAPIHQTATKQWATSAP